MGSDRIWVPPGGSADPGRSEQADDAPPRQPTEQELAAELREQLANAKISDLLVQTVYTVSSLGYHKLASESRDLEQARLAIESIQALLPVLEDAVPEELVRDFRQVVANMQFAYADAVTESEPKPERQPAAEEDGTPEDDSG
jgi:hypothetical protein